MTTRWVENQHFVHVLKKPATPYLFVPTFAAEGALGRAVRDQALLNYKQQPEGLFIYLDRVKDGAWDTVLEVKTNR